MLSMDQPDFCTLFNDELTTVPTSLFKDSRNASTKSAWKNKLKLKCSPQTFKHDLVVINDNSGMLHSSVYWQKEGLVEDLQSWTKYLRQALVFIRNTALPGKFNFYFSEVFS